METKYLKINPADNVVVAISDLKAGETITVDGHVITLKEDVPAGHKVTLKDFAQGENIIKYGYPIGHALTAVEQGHWINENQIKTNLAGLFLARVELVEIFMVGTNVPNGVPRPVVKSTM